MVQIDGHSQHCTVLSLLGLKLVLRRLSVLFILMAHSSMGANANNRQVTVPIVLYRTKIIKVIDLLSPPLSAFFLLFYTLIRQSVALCLTDSFSISISLFVTVFHSQQPLFLVSLFLSLQQCWSFVYELENQTANGIPS